MCYDSPLGLLAPTVLAFGDGTAPFTFHKITRPLVVFSHLVGIRVMSYLDDFLWMSEPERAEATSKFAQWLLPLLGWVPNLKKSDWTIGTVKESLGFVVDSTAMRLRVPEDKVSRIVAQIDEILGTPQTTVGAVHSLWGTIVSLRPALQGASAYCYEIGRQTVAERASGREGEDVMSLSPASTAELTMLRTHIRVHGPRGLPIPSTTQNVSVWSDAGEVGIGGHTSDAKQEFATALPEELIGSSSTRRELYGLRKVALALGDVIRGKKVLFHMDSRPGVQNMLNQGGSKRDLNAEFRAWLQVVDELKIEPYFTWVPREENTRADALSKRVPLEWKLSEEARAAINTFFPDKEWVLPNLNQIGNVLLEARCSGKDVVLVHPVWPGAAWWNLVQAHSVERAHLPTADQSLVSTKKGWKGPPRWRMQATLLRFTAAA
jgi:hypothetical protein